MNQSVYRIVVQRQLEEEVTEDLFTILGHLVLLWFTGDTHTTYCMYKNIYNEQNRYASTPLLITSCMHTCNGFQRTK